MTVVYFDSSAFVKLLVDEDGSELAVTLWDECDAAVSSRIAYPEVRAALAAARRSRRLSPAAGRRAESIWESYWAATRPVELSAAVADAAGQLAADHALRGADAVHLASLLALGPRGTIFAVWDARLGSGAHALGVAVAPAIR